MTFIGDEVKWRHSPHPRAASGTHHERPDPLRHDRLLRRRSGPAPLVPLLVIGIVAVLLLAVPAPSHLRSFIVIVALVMVLAIRKSVAQSRRRRHVVSATRIDGEETWLRGVHEFVVRALTR
jgi:hypothetical protein